MADSLYGNHLFLAVFLLVKTVVVLVRVHGNSVFYERLKQRQKGQRGTPAKYGTRFKLSTPARPGDRSETFRLGQQTVVLSA